MTKSHAIKHLDRATLMATLAVYGRFSDYEVSLGRETSLREGAEGKCS